MTEPTARLAVPAHLLKATREALCSAQNDLIDRGTSDYRLNLDLLGSLINAIDHHRPLGADGEHGDRHTATCGCPDAPFVDEGEKVDGSLLGRLERIVYPMGVHSTALDVSAAARSLVDGSTVREYRHAITHAEDRRIAAHAEIARVDTLEHVLRAEEAR